jgi:hypothetical protein
MFKRIVCISIIAAFAMIGQTIDQAVAQPAQTMRVNGTVESFDGRVLAIKSDSLGVVKINVPENLTVFDVSSATLADVKPNSFIGVGAMPQADGSQRAIQVTVFAETQRGTGEGHRPWDARPNSTMTNATVDQTVGGVDGQMVTVKYKDGEKKIIIPADAVIRAYSIGDKSELKPGTAVAIVRAVKKPDGSLETDRVNVGRGVTP